MIIDLRDIYKDYNQGNMPVPVLKDVCLQVEEGEYVAIMGESGAGKSTLLNSILGMKLAITSDKAGTTRNVINNRFHISITSID